MRRTHNTRRQDIKVSNKEAREFASSFVSGIQNSILLENQNSDSAAKLNNKKWPIQYELSARYWQRSNSFQAGCFEGVESSCPEDSHFENSFGTSNSFEDYQSFGRQEISLSEGSMMQGNYLNSYYQKNDSPTHLSSSYENPVVTSNVDSLKYGKKCPVCNEINEKNSNWCMECGKAIISVEIRRYNEEGEPFSLPKQGNSLQQAWNYSYSPPRHIQQQASIEKDPLPNNLSMLMEDMRISNPYPSNVNLSPNDPSITSSVSFDFENPQFDDIHYENFKYSKHHAVYRRASTGGNEKRKEKEDFYPFDDLLYPEFAIYDPNLGYAFPSSNIVSNGFYFQQQSAYPFNSNQQFGVNETPLQQKSQFAAENRKKKNLQKKRKKKKFNKSPVYNQRFPGYSPQDFVKFNEVPNGTEENECHWGTLPDEIILHIFGYLKMKDIISCLQVCRNFYKIANDSVLWKEISFRKHLNLTDNVLQKIAWKHPTSLSLVQCNGKQITSEGLRYLFKTCAESLEKLDVSCCHGGVFVGESILLYAAVKCQNIKSLDVSWSNVSNNSIQSISKASTRLEKLCLNGCQAITDDSIIKIVKKHGESLEVLEVLGCFNISFLSTNAVSEYCKRLIKLNVGQCHKITNGALSTISKSLPKLQVLDIRGCKQIRDISLKNIAVGCQQLKTIVIANCPLITDASLAAIAVHLPKLECIDVCGCGKISDRGVLSLVKGCRQMKSLDLSSTKVTHKSVTGVGNYNRYTIQSLKLSFCHSITDQCLRTVVERSKRLQTLHLYGCKPLRHLAKLLEINPSLKIERESLR
eukprot:TCONS_00066167-protein